MKIKKGDKVWFFCDFLGKTIEGVVVANDPSRDVMEIKTEENSWMVGKTLIHKL